MSDCIEWAAGCTTAGYGEFWRDGKVVYAHRAAWEARHGPIPAGMTVHHLCENRRCVNTEHMELLRRDDHAGAAGHGKLTYDDAQTIRALIADGSTAAAAARQFGVSETLARNIRDGRAWPVREAA